MRKLTEIIVNKPSDVEAHLMQANIFLAQKCTSAAENSLQTALSGNFGVKSWPQYHVVHGRILLTRAKVPCGLPFKRRPQRELQPLIIFNVPTRHTLCIPLEV